MRKLMLVTVTTAALAACFTPDVPSRRCTRGKWRCPEGQTCNFNQEKCVPVGTKGLDASLETGTRDRSVDAAADLVKPDVPAVDAPAVDAPAVDLPAVDAPAVDTTTKDKGPDKHKPDLKLDGPVPDQPSGPCVAPNGKMCSGNGICLNGKCTCYAEYAPPLCDKCATGYYDPKGSGVCIFNPCTPNPCMNGGTCSNITGKAVCTCTGNWDPVKKCTVCKAGWDKSTNCTTCLPGYSPPNCTAIKPMMKAVVVKCSGNCKANTSYTVEVSVENTKSFTAAIKLRGGPGAKGMCGPGTIKPSSGPLSSPTTTFKLIWQMGAVSVEPCAVSIDIKLQGAVSKMSTSKYVDVYK